MTVYFDMDGTIADLYSVENWLQKLRAEDASPYADAKPLCDMNKIIPKLKQLQYLGIKIGVLSWCSKQATKEYNAAVRKAKRIWLKEYLPDFKFDEIHIAPYGTPKERIAKDFGWLIDDEDLNRSQWELKRGNSFDPTKETIIEILDKILSFV